MDKENSAKANLLIISRITGFKVTNLKQKITL
jgi:hypothetical protein